MRNFRNLPPNFHPSRLGILPGPTHQGPGRELELKIPKWEFIRQWCAFTSCVVNLLFRREFTNRSITVRSLCDFLCVRPPLIGQNLRHAPYVHCTKWTHPCGMPLLRKSRTQVTNGTTSPRTLAHQPNKKKSVTPNGPSRPHPIK